MVKLPDILKEQYTGLAFELALSICICSLMLNIICIVRICYSEKVITKLTIVPYIFSLCLITVMLAEAFGFCLFVGVIYDKSWIAFTMTTVKNKLFLKLFGLTNVKIALLLLFILAKSFGDQITLFFVTYQHRCNL